MKDGIEVVAETRGGGKVVEVDLYRCSDPAVLRRILTQRAGSIALFLADPEWPLRVERDAGGREIMLTELANVGLLLARITEMIEAPPDELREHALNHEMLRKADALLATRGNVIEFPRAAS